MTGMREQEVMHTYWSDVNLEQAIVRVTHKQDLGWTPKAYKELMQPDATTIRLTARSTAIINGIRAELRGDYRATGAPIRLNAQLENVNLRIGTPVAFCVLHNGVQHLAGRGRVALVAGILTAKIELEATDGDRVPVVTAGDRLQTRQKKITPFNLPPTCGSPLLASAQFH